jgi:hemoglobin
MTRLEVGETPGLPGRASSAGVLETGSRIRKSGVGEEPGTAGHVDRSTTPDLDHRGAIHDCVVRFYREVVFDEVLEPMFDEVAELDWAEHIPRLIDYWCRVLLDEPNLARPIIATHSRVHDLEPFRTEHFDRWYSLWVGVVAGQWQGPYATKAMAHAARIADVLSRRLIGVSWCPDPTATEPRPDQDH